LLWYWNIPKDKWYWSAKWKENQKPCCNGELLQLPFRIFFLIAFSPDYLLLFSHYHGVATEWNTQTNTSETHCIQAIQKSPSHFFSYCHKWDFDRTNLNPAWFKNKAVLQKLQIWDIFIKIFSKFYSKENGWISMNISWRDFS
jgi:hypothetical protein